MEKNQGYQRLKFYFDGDSFTYGGGLGKRLHLDPTKYRWSKLVCDHFGAEEINASSSGACNETVMRNLFHKPTTKVYDFYFLQTTVPIRGEFYDDRKKRWMRYGFSGYDDLESRCIDRWGLVEGPKFADWIRFRFGRMFSDYGARTQESIVYNSFKAYVASVGRLERSFFSTLLTPQETDNKYDIHFGMQSSRTGLVFDRIPNDGHPSVEGHKTIAKYVIDIVSERLYNESSVC